MLASNLFHCPDPRILRVAKRTRDSLSITARLRVNVSRGEFGNDFRFCTLGGTRWCCQVCPPWGQLELSA